MRWPTLVLVLLIALLQYPLVVRQGRLAQGMGCRPPIDGPARGQPEAREPQRRARRRVRDLKSGYEAIEERARYELGYIKPDEVFVQVPQKNP
ncbi:MAG: septum formation initiator family protein [Rhodocyclaceae bacterium]|nr:septum formation initiator family protein [Rhodocyclaceae bacterium]